jgi:hypothetical protein
MIGHESFTTLESWGDTTLGMVTGNKRYVALSPARLRELGLARRETIRLSPPGSTHLRGLSFSELAVLQVPHCPAARLTVLRGNLCPPSGRCQQLCENQFPSQ